MHRANRHNADRTAARYRAAGRWPGRVAWHPWLGATRAEHDLGAEHAICPGMSEEGAATPERTCTWSRMGLVLFSMRRLSLGGADADKSRDRKGRARRIVMTATPPAACAVKDPGIAAALRRANRRSGSPGVPGGPTRGLWRDAPAHPAPGPGRGERARSESERQHRTPARAPTGSSPGAEKRLRHFR